MKAVFYPSVQFESLMLPFIYKEIYIDRVYEVLSGTKDLTILDIGANIGLVTQHMLPHARKIYAVEPSPLEFEALARNREFGEWANVEIFQCAIADRDGEMDFTINIGNRTMNSLAVGQRGPDGLYSVAKSDPLGMDANRISVRTRRLDTFFQENGIEKVDFMKLDVEGAEDMILRGEGFKNVADRIRAIEIEFHFPNWMELACILLSLGYQGRRLSTQANICLFYR